MGKGEGGVSRCWTEGKVDCIDGRGLCIVKHKSVFVTWNDILDKKIQLPYEDKPKLKSERKKTTKNKTKNKKKKKNSHEIL